MDFSDCNTIGEIKLKQELLQMSSVFPVNGQLYHYTSPQGLEGILKKETIELRFTRADCLNDMTEGHHILEYYKSICIRLLNDKLIDHDFFNSIIDLVPKTELAFFYESNPPQLVNGIHLMDFCVSEYTSYVFCFSTLSDSLALWNYYLKNGRYEGYNLGFRSEMVKDSFHYHPNRLDIHSEFVVVEYDYAEKDDVFLDFMESMFRLRNTDDINLSNTKRAISDELFKWRYSFKPQCFKHESEIRLVLHIPLNKDKSALASFIKPNLRYEENSGIPKYIFAPLNKIAICQITTSPLFNKQGCDALGKDLKSKGYDVNINYSEIPIRF